MIDAATGTCICGYTLANRSIGVLRGEQIGSDNWHTVLVVTADAGSVPAVAVCISHPCACDT
jgi:hypothetical protein